MKFQTWFDGSTTPRNLCVACVSSESSKPSLADGAAPARLRYRIGPNRFPHICCFHFGRCEHGGDEHRCPIPGVASTGPYPRWASRLHPVSARRRHKLTSTPQAVHRHPLRCIDAAGLTFMTLTLTWSWLERVAAKRRSLSVSMVSAEPRAPFARALGRLSLLHTKPGISRLRRSTRPTPRARSPPGRGLTSRGRSAASTREGEEPL